jgi:hypothetical protein
VLLIAEDLAEKLKWIGFEEGLKKFLRLFPTIRTKFERLVAVTGADGDLVTALGATAAEHGCTGLGLHTGEKPVSLRAVAAVRLKGALRHGTDS